MLGLSTRLARHRLRLAQLRRCIRGLPAPVLLVVERLVEARALSTVGLSERNNPSAIITAPGDVRSSHRAPFAASVSRPGDQPATANASCPSARPQTCATQ